MPLGFALVFVILFIVYKESEKHNVISYTFKLLSDTFDGYQVNSSSLNFSKFKLPESLRRIILQLEDDENPGNETVVIVKAEDFTKTGFKVVHSNETVSTEKLKVALQDVCQCDRGNCACCVIVDIPEFSHSVCVNATYNPTTIGLNLSVGVDGHYFSQEISLRNPPPFCFSLPIPGAEPTVCVAFTKMDVDPKTEVLTGCVDLEIELLHLRLVTIDLGCFEMPI